MNTFIQAGCYRSLAGLSDSRRRLLTELTMQIFSKPAIRSIGSDNIVDMLTPKYEIGKPEILLLGESNAGKSSLLKRTLRVTGIQTGPNPGLTVLLKRYVQNNSVSVLDAPGYGYVLRERRVPHAILQQKLIQQYIQARSSSLLHKVYLLVPVLPTGSLSAADLSIIANCKMHRVPLTIIVSKIDLVGGSTGTASCLQIMEQEPYADVIPFSKNDPELVDMLREDMVHSATSWLLDEDLNIDILQSLKYNVPTPTREEIETLLKDIPVRISPAEKRGRDRRAMGLSDIGGTPKVTTADAKRVAKNEYRLIQNELDRKYKTQTQRKSEIPGVETLISHSRFLREEEPARKNYQNPNIVETDFSTSPYTKKLPKGGRFKKSINKMINKRSRKQNKLANFLTGGT